MIILAALLICLLYILFAPAGVQADYAQKCLTVKVKLGFIKFTVVPKKDKGKKGKDKKNKKDKKDTEGQEQEKEKEKRPWHETAMALLDAYNKTAGKIRRHVKVQKLELLVRYGHEDAAVTGIVTGLGYAVFYQLFGVIASAFSYSPPKFEITPVYNDPQLEVTFHGIIKARLVHIIRIAYEFIKALI